MWNEEGSYSLDQAQRFLREDFRKVIVRTRFLYIDRADWPDCGPGLFEPVLLCMCWIDFLGALMIGDARQHRANARRSGSTTFGKELVAKVVAQVFGCKNQIGDGGVGSTARSKEFIAKVLGRQNPKYLNTQVGQQLVKSYRGGTVHAYAPASFNLDLDNGAIHLQLFSKNQLGISVRHMIDELDDAVLWFADHIDDPRAFSVSGYGTLDAFNRARNQYLKRSI